jgi:hypothetical protein
MNSKNRKAFILRNLGKRRGNLIDKKEIEKDEYSKYGKRNFFLILTVLFLNLLMLYLKRGGSHSVR